MVGITGSTPSEVYDTFEEFIDEGDISYPSSSIIDDEELTIDTLHFGRIEGSRKFYNMVIEGGKIEVAVEVSEIDEMLSDDDYRISGIESLDDGGKLGDHLEEYFSVNNLAEVSR